jgi:hypothetical protein
MAMGLSRLLPLGQQANQRRIACLMSPQGRNASASQASEGTAGGSAGLRASPLPMVVHRTHPPERNTATFRNALSQRRRGAGRE